MKALMPKGAASRRRLSVTASSAALEAPYWTNSSSVRESLWERGLSLGTAAAIQSFHKNHHADRSALGTNRDEREQTNGRLSCKIRFEEEAYYNAR